MIGSQLKEVAKGGAASFLGNLLNNALRLVAGVVIIRYVSKSQFGLLSLGDVVISVAAVVSGLGLANGVPRFISKYRATLDKERAAGVIGSSLCIACVSSILSSAVLLFFSNAIANSMGKPEVAPVLKAFALMVPPLAIMGNLTAIFRGLKRIKPKIVFENVVIYAVRIVVLIFVVIAGWHFKGILVAYVSSVWIGFLLYALYGFRKLNLELGIRTDVDLVKDLIRFCAPLLGLALINKTLSWTATLTLGCLHTSDAVGLYNVPTRLTNFLPLPLVSLLFLYLPVATNLFEKGQTKNLQALYVSVTKWAFLLTLPFLLFLLLDSEFVISFVFGDKYAGSANILRILAVGFSINTFLGPNGTTLIASGATTEVFWSTVAGALTAVGLCIALVPGFGALGAAMATSIGIIVSNVARSLALFVKHRIHPLSPQYMKPVWLTIFVSILLSVVTASAREAHPLLHIALAVALVMISVSSPFWTRSVDSADLAALRSLENRVHGRTPLSDRLHQWFELDEPA